MREGDSIPEFQCEKYKLGNGLEVTLFEDHRLPLVAVNIWYHVGPADERPGLTGFAHLFEHMMFEGSRHVGEKAHFQYLEAAGATTVNGSTDFDRTNYYETVPSNRLDLALWLESDRMGFLLDTLDERLLSNQRDVVRNERRQTVENSPYGLAQEEVYRQLFPPNHPYHAAIMGSHADIESARLGDAREFFRRYYVPNNASLAIVGDFAPEEARALVEKYFAPFPAGEPAPRIRAATPPIMRERRAVVGDRVELPRVFLAWLTPPIFSQGDAECDLLARILGGGRSSRLYRGLVYEKRLAQDVGAQQGSMALSSIFAVEGTCKPGVGPQLLEDAMREELERMADEGPREAEVERARNCMETALVRGMENITGLANRFNLYNHYVGTPRYFREDFARYRKVTPDSLRRTAREYLRREAGVALWGVSGEKVVHDPPKQGRPAGQAEQVARGDAAAPSPSAPPIPGQEWRAAPPPAGPAPSLRLPVPRRFRLPGGLTALLVEQHDLPIVAANVVVLGGADRNPVELPGLASFTAEMLDEGTATRSPIEIAAAIDQIGASLTCGSSADISWAAVRALKKNADAAFEILADVLLRPAFAPEEVERIRHDRLTRILQQKDLPAAVAVKSFFLAVYGDRHPYGFTDVGTEESNRAVTRELLAEFHRTGYFPANAALAVAGDLTEAELARFVERHFGGWGDGGADRRPAAAPPAPPAPPGGDGRAPSRRVIVIDRPGAPQTVLRIGHVGVSRSHPDYVALDVMNTVFGGMFSSRVNQNLRERHGYTYGASSVFAFRRGAGPFLVGTSVQTEATAPAVTEIFREIDRMREEAVSDAELEAARDSIARSLPGEFETTSAAASSIGQLFVHGLPDDYYENLPQEVAQVSAADVLRVARAHLRPEESVVVAVGDGRRLAPELEGLGIGPVEVQAP
ncbi:MAG: insulinase family protein [Acidobacteriota bacterium]|nr:insulinase family protein [Acidobacteriota bacterium]